MENKTLSKSFLWMAIGLLVTFITGIAVYNSEKLLIALFVNNLYIAAIIAELVLVLVLSARVTKLSESTAKVLFILYAFVSGLTFSSIFVIYRVTSIIYVFLIASGIYAALSFAGTKLNKDLSKFGTYFSIGIIGIIIASIFNIFIGSDLLSLVLCIVALVLFLGVTIYDVQKIKKLPDFPNAAIYGALDLYLDFINIFIRLLQLFGNRKN